MAQLNKRFVWNSFNAKNFNEIPQVTDDMIVVITNANNPHIAIINAEGLSDEQRIELVKVHAEFITLGCNYTYDVVKVIGNTYFLN